MLEKATDVYLDLPYKRLWKRKVVVEKEGGGGKGRWRWKRKVVVEKEGG